MTRSLSIIRPDDWHVHFRDHEVLVHTVSATAQHFGRALVMPNLQPPLCSIDATLAYRQRILNALKKSSSFTPYMTLYLNESVTAEELQQVKFHSEILGAKLYPAGATTNSDQGVRSIDTLYPLLEIMQDHGLVLQIHGEVTHGDIFNREALFLSECLKPLMAAFPKLRIVLEHVSSRAAVEFVEQAPDHIAATITPHHLLYNRNHLLAGGVKPHYYCLPILKKEADQKSLLRAAGSGNPKFFAGTDSAPHAQPQKESACGCAGVFSAPIAVAMYAHAFSTMDKLKRLEPFLSCFGADFYQLALSKEKIELIETPQQIPLKYPFGKNQVIPVAAGSTLPWSVNHAI